MTLLLLLTGEEGGSTHTGLFTTLSLSATPGRRWSFSPKILTVPPVTELSLMATPGKPHSFAAKTAAPPVETTGYIYLPLLGVG